MGLTATSLEVRLPDKRQRAAAAYARKKPMAEVTVHVEGGRTREIAVPARVGRLLGDGAGLGLPMPEDEAFDAVHALEGRVCLTMITEMLSRRDHAEGEVRDKLTSYGFRPQEIDRGIERARSMRFLDDARFASYFIEERKRRGWGRRRIEAELKRRGVDPVGVEGWPEAYFPPEGEIDRARSILDKKRVPDRRAFEKLTRSLMAKGFDYQTASAAVRERLQGVAGS